MGIAERKEREKRQRKEHILEVARRLFQERGFLNVTIADIAEAAEFSIGTLYLYFKNKEDIYAGLAYLGSQKFDELIDQALHKKARLSHQDLVQFIERFLNIYADYGSYFDVLMLNFRGKGMVNLSDGYASALRQITQSSLSKSTEYFTRRFPEKRDKEEAARATTFTIWAFLLGLSHLLDVGRTQLLGEEDVRRIIAKAADLLKDVPIELSAR